VGVEHWHGHRSLFGSSRLHALMCHNWSVLSPMKNTFADRRCASTAAPRAAANWLTAGHSYSQAVPSPPCRASDGFPRSGGGGGGGPPCSPLTPATPATPATTPNSTLPTVPSSRVNLT